jgi:hypothetical protein
VLARQVQDHLSRALILFFLMLFFQMASHVFAQTCLDCDPCTYVSHKAGAYDTKTDFYIHLFFNNVSFVLRDAKSLSVLYTVG